MTLLLFHLIFSALIIAIIAIITLLFALFVSQTIISIIVFSGGSAWSRRPRTSDRKTRNQGEGSPSRKRSSFGRGYRVDRGSL